MIDLPEDVLTPIATLSVPNLPAGDYFISYAFEIDFKGAKNESVHFQANVDGSTGTLFDIQSDKKANFKNRLYGYPRTRTAGDFTMEFFMMKEAGFTTQVDVNFCDLVIERKG